MTQKSPQSTGWNPIIIRVNCISPGSNPYADARPLRGALCTRRAQGDRIRTLPRGSSTRGASAHLRKWRNWQPSLHRRKRDSARVAITS
jgi:hypothetical protein